MHILPLNISHLDSILDLYWEFGGYLNSIAKQDTGIHDRESQKNRYLHYAFSKNPSFTGYVAKLDGAIVGYAMYHYGFDPDEMQWKVIYLIDFFVSEKARGHWVGRALIEKLQSHEDSLWLYFWVWKKNISAIGFYKKMWADWIEDVPFMKLMK